MKTITLTQRIPDLYVFLRSTDADEIIARTTYIPGSWHEAEFDANRVGFRISRFIHEDYLRNQTFAECHRLIRC